MQYKAWVVQLNMIQQERLFLDSKRSPKNLSVCMRKSYMHQGEELLFMLTVQTMMLAMQFFRRRPKSVAALCDEDLIREYSQGDFSAFETLYERHKHGVYNFLKRTVQSVEVAEELLQDVFLRVVQNASRYEPKAKFRTWLYAIARNLCIDRYRKKRGVVELSLQQDTRPRDGAGHNLEQRLEDPKARGRSEHTTFYQEVGDFLEEALQRLPTEQRE
ncbi:MAG: sigma-70 family RNA polymerase sigma factor, partial [Myxococcota bacterium]